MMKQADNLNLADQSFEEMERYSDHGGDGGSRWMRARRRNLINIPIPNCGESSSRLRRKPRSFDGIPGNPGCKSVQASL